MPIHSEAALLRCSFSKEVGVSDLTKDQVNAMGHAVGLNIQDPELAEVTYSINALLEALDEINPPGLDAVEPLPIIIPPMGPSTRSG